MHKRIRTALSLLVCVMMLLTQFAFALEEGNVDAGAEAAASEIENEEVTAEEKTPEEPAEEEEASEEETEEPAEEAAPEEKAEEAVEEEAAPEEKAEKPAKEETEKEESMPAFSGEAELGGVKVSVKAAKGVFPEGAELSVEKVSNDAQKKVDKAVDAARDDDLNVAAAYTFDVKILDKNGEEVQPADNNKAEVSFRLDEADDANLDAAVYHLAESKNGLVAEELKTDTAKDEVSAVTDGFSYYTVEFTYGGLQYVMDGNSSVALADILGKVGLEGEASVVSVSNDRLFSAEKKAGKWMVTTHRAFTSEEWMKVTIDGIVYEIVVTDAVPGDNVTTEVQMAANDLKEGNFTIENGGVVLGPKNGTATIKNGTVTNNAENSRKGGYNTTKGSAFVACGPNSFLFQNVTINSGANNLVFNIWQNCSITAENTTLNGSTNSSIDVPFLMIGGYSNGPSGTLNFEGTSDIVGAKGSIIGGNGSSVINVNDGTLTINNSEIVLENGIKLIANSGASLIVKGTTELTGTKPTIKSGATLDITSSGKYTLDNVGSSFDFEEGAVLKVSSFKISEVIVNNGEKVTISGTGDIAKEDGWNITRKIGNKNVTIKATEITVAEDAPVTVKSGGELTFDNVTLAGRSNITIEKDGKAWLKGTNTFDNCTISNSGEINVEGDSAEIKNSSLTFNGNSGVIKVGKDQTLTIDPTTIRPTGKQQVQVYGTFNLEETKADLSGNGAIRWIRIEDGGTANISDSELSGSTSLGVIRANAGSTLNIDKSTFKNNIANGSGEQNNGGVILARDSEITITKSEFKENRAAVDGGAIWQEDNTILSVDGESKFTNNIANSRGGAIYAKNSSVTIGDGVAFEENHAGSVTTTAAGNGGALYLEGCTTSIGRAAFRKNGTHLPGEADADSAGIYTQSGGAVNATNGSLTIKGTTFNENIAFMLGNAQGSGGAIHVTGTTMMISGAAFEDNAGQLYGGAVTLGMRSKAYVNDLNGKPTMFTGNAVLYGAEFAGGAVCVHGNGTSEQDASLIMEDAAIYNNYAEGAGGGISTCQQGTSKVLVMDGAAIYDNTSGDGPISDTKEYGDIYIFRNGTASQDDSELYERMFNGGLHNWNDKTVDVKEAWAGAGTAKIAGSNPTDRDISKAKVIFTGNRATSHPKLEGAVASGGAISNNGFLQIGSMAEIKILKLWDDKANTSARPDKEEFLKKITILANGEEISKDDLVIDVITEDVDKYALFQNIVDDDNKPADFGDKTPWLIIVSGLPKKTGTGEIIEYTIKEDALSNYRLVKSEGDMETYFKLENKVRLMDIPVEKVWDEEDKYTGLRPGEITVNLLADGRKVKELKLSESNNWKGTFRDLVRYNGDKEIRYTVEEVKDENLSYYTSSVTGDAASGFVITNKLEVHTASETGGTKIWKGDDDVPDKRPSEITVKLLADGKVFKTVTVSETDDWKIEFGDLPEYKDGKKIHYTIKEVKVEGYEASYDGFDIINTYTGAKPDESDADDNGSKSKSRGVGTGDNSPVGALILLVAAGTAGITGIAVRRRKSSEE